jgi:hypothetical protein
MIFLFMLPCIDEITGMPLCSAIGRDSGIMNFLSRLALNHKHPDLSLWSSYDFRFEPVPHLMQYSGPELSNTPWVDELILE